MHLILGWSWLFLVDAALVVTTVCPSCAQALVGFCTLLYLACTGELFAVLLMMYMLVVMLVDHPRPHTYLWKGVMLYLVLVRWGGVRRAQRAVRSRVYVQVIMLKAFLQLTIICMHTDSENVWRTALWYQAQCKPNPERGQLSLLQQAINARASVQWSVLLGLSKYSEAGYGGDGLLHAVKWPFVVLSSMILHRHVLVRRGLWNVPRFSLFSDATKATIDQKARQAGSRQVVCCLGEG
jgi:hypothetical protein